MFKTGMSFLGAVFLVLALAGPSTACDMYAKAKLLKDKACPQCNLRECDLHNTNLEGANLKEADLSGADLYGADLTGADLTGARWVNGRTCKNPSIGGCK